MRREYLLPLILVAIAAMSLSVNYWILNRTSTLAQVEIREYQGRDLSSVDDFRENSIRGPQYIDKDEYRLRITGLVRRNLTYTYEQAVSQHRQHEKIVTLYCVEGWEVTILWEGVLVKDLIYAAGLDQKANTLIFHAYDGYTTSLPLHYIEDKNIVLANKMNGVTLPPERGFPFQLVAESKWGYKWIKWVTQIEVSDDPDYRGYWESRGYSNNADLDESFFGE